MQNFSRSFSTLDDFINECIKICPIVDVKDNVVYLKQPLNSSRVNAVNFRLRLQDLEKETRYSGNKNGFSEEFESLQQADGKYLYERKVGCLPENRAKNRFKTILPFDHTRIKLVNRSNEPNSTNDSDYINANRITSEESFSKVYLATQGPLPNTINDFWHMVWQEESQIILMITHEEEKGRPKCARYWPDPLDFPGNGNGDLTQCSQVYATIKVKLIGITRVNNDYVLREFLVSDNNNNIELTSTRTVYQFQYLAWSDHGVPENQSNTLDFIEHFNSLYSQLGNNKPLTVHCSAGIGRTGAILIIDQILDKIKILGIQCDLDIYKAVCHLRSQRSGMIQTEKQYQFSHMAIRQFIEKFEKKSSSPPKAATSFATSTRTSSLSSVHSNSGNKFP
jgi:tyrosine-protein phosphatase non-receptor type 11